VFNGRLDWVYEEELAERSGRAYEWAPDSGSLAFLRLDENRVPAYPLVNFLSLPHAAYQPQRYPNPGDPNSIPELRVVSGEGKPLAHVTFAPDDDLYVVPWLGWTADSKTLVYELLNRTQTEWTAKRLDVASGTSATVVQERDASWINVTNLEPRHAGAPVFA